MQRPLKLAQYLPALGIETHVLAPDDPKWIHADPELRVPTQAWVHRARYLGPEGPQAGRGAARQRRGSTRASTQARLRVAAPARAGRERDLEPDRDPGRDPHRARRGHRRRDHHLAAGLRPPRRRRRQACDRRARGSPTCATRSSRTRTGARSRRPCGRRRRSTRRVARLVARSADAIACVSDAIAEEARALSPRGPVETIANGCDFDDFAGLEYRPAPRFRITHTGSFFGKRDPRPFLQALADSGLDVVARFVGDFRSADREWAEGLGLGDRLELIPYAPRATALELQRDSEALLLLIPEAGGRGKGVLSGKVFEYLAAERPILAAVPPDGAAAELIREAGAGVVAPPDDVDALARGARRAARAVRERRACRPSSCRPSSGAGSRARRGSRRRPSCSGRSWRRREPDGRTCTSTRLPSHARRRRGRRPRHRRAAPRDRPHGQLREAAVERRRRAVALGRADGRLPRRRSRAAGSSAATRGCRAARRSPALFFVAFLLVYLAGFFNLETAQALAQWAKGMVKFLLHFLFLVAGDRATWRGAASASTG